MNQSRIKRISADAMSGLDVIVIFGNRSEMMSAMLYIEQECGEALDKSIRANGNEQIYLHGGGKIYFISLLQALRGQHADVVYFDASVRRLDEWEDGVLSSIIPRDGIIVV